MVRASNDRKKWCKYGLEFKILGGPDKMDAIRFHGDNNTTYNNEKILISLTLQLHQETSPVVFCNTLKLLT